MINNGTSWRHDGGTGEATSKQNAKICKPCICEFCGILLSTVRNRSRHHSICKIKQHKEENIKDKLLNEKEKEIKELKNELRDLEKDFLKFAKEQINSNKSVINNTNNGTIDNRQYNMYYVINNYKDAHNIEDLLNSPLTEEEKKYILDNGSILGCYKLLQSRCIDDIEIDKRPFHCIDISRCKYLLRSKNDWDVDQCGESILTYGCNKITKKVFFRAKK